jgi:acyl carrier protein
MGSERQEIEQILIDLLSNYANGQAIDSGTRLVADLGLESVRILEFVVEVEDRFDVAIDMESLSNVYSVADLAAVVSRLRNG